MPHPAPRPVRILLGTVAILAAVIALAFGAAYGSQRGAFAVPQTVADDPSLPVIEAAGYRFHGQTFGHPDSPVIIALHGGPGNDYRSLLPLGGLQDEYFVVFYDQRGAGLSPRVPTQQLTFSRYLDDLDAIVDRFGGERGVVLIGHSFGAMLASAYLGAHPDKVSGAVLVEPGFLTSALGDQFMERTNRMRPLHPGLKDLHTLAVRWLRSLHVDSKDGHGAADWFAAALVHMPMADHPIAGYFCGRNRRSGYLPYWRYGAAASNSLLSSILREDGKVEAEFATGARDFDKEVLFLAGACNTIIGKDVQEAHARLFPAATVQVIPDAGHTLIGEAPRRTLVAIRNYLQRVRATGWW